jgi:hypothetical protein
MVGYPFLSVCSAISKNIGVFNFWFNALFVSPAQAGRKSISNNLLFIHGETGTGVDV